MRDIINLFKIKKEKKNLELITIGKTNLFIISISDKLNLKDLLLFQKLEDFYNMIILIIKDMDELYESNIIDFFDLIICFLIELNCNLKCNKNYINSITNY